MQTIKRPAIFLAQFAGDAAPLNSLGAIAEWAGELGYKGVQIPSWDGRLLDLKRQARAVAGNAQALRECSGVQASGQAGAPKGNVTPTARGRADLACPAPAWAEPSNSSAHGRCAGDDD